MFINNLISNKGQEKKIGRNVVVEEITYIDSNTKAWLEYTQ